MLAGDTLCKASRCWQGTRSDLCHHGQFGQLTQVGVPPRRCSPCPLGLPPAARLVPLVTLTHARTRAAPRGGCAPQVCGDRDHPGSSWEGPASPPPPKTRKVPVMALMEISWAGLPPCASRQHPLTKPGMERDFFPSPQIFSDCNGDICPDLSFQMNATELSTSPAAGSREGALLSLHAAQLWSHLYPQPGLQKPHICAKLSPAVQQPCPQGSARVREEGV